MKLPPNGPYFIFDVESVGLHGQGFAVAGAIYFRDHRESEFCHSCHPYQAIGTNGDMEWVHAHVPDLMPQHKFVKDVCNAFWEEWMRAKEKYPDILMAAECGWPVEARFLQECISIHREDRNWKGPYPLHEIATVMACAGMDPMAKYERTEQEKPEHHPVGDSRLSARLLFEALQILKNSPC